MRLARRLLAVMVLCAPLVAAAQPARTPPSELARAQADAARRHFDAKEYDKAAAALRAALRFDPKPSFMYALGQAQRMGGDCAAAIQSYEQFLGTAPPARQAEAARENIARCVAELKARPATQPLVVAPVASQPAEEGPRRAPWYKDVLGDALCGGGLALAIAGAAAWGVGRAEARKANDAGTYDGWAAHSDGALAMQQAGIAVLSLGGALIAAGVVRYVLRPARRLERPVVSAAPARGGGALLVAGTF
jgi:tetratricopeptide (TPR) repeat protein